MDWLIEEHPRLDGPKAYEACWAVVAMTFSKGDPHDIDFTQEVAVIKDRLAQHNQPEAFKSWAKDYLGERYEKYLKDV